jgi:hypothetical protein
MSTKFNAATKCIIVLAISLTFLTGNANAYLPPYFAYVDKVEPAIPEMGLEEEELGGAGTDIAICIANHGQDDIIIYNESGSSELYNITPNAVYVNNSGIWDVYCNRNSIYFSDWIGNVGDALDKPNTIVKHWKIFGRTNHTNFTIYGNTVYLPFKESTNHLVLSAVFECIVIFVSAFAIYWFARGRREQSEKANFSKGAFFGVLTTTATMYAVHFINPFLKYIFTEFLTTLVALIVFSFIAGRYSTSKITSFRIGFVSGSASLCIFLVQRFFNLPRIIYLEDWIIDVLFRDIAGFMALSVLAGLFCGLFGMFGAIAKKWWESKKNKLSEN